MQARGGDGPFMEFLAVVALLAGAGAALLLLTLRPDAPNNIVQFFTGAAQTLLGAVVALAYAAQRNTTNSNNDNSTTSAPAPVDKTPGK